VEELYDGKAKPKVEDVCLEDNAQTDLQGPPLLLSKFETALKELKTEGIDGIPAELLKALGSRGRQELFQICCEIYVSGEWPADFLESIMIPVEKKRSIRMC